MESKLDHVIGKWGCSTAGGVVDLEQQFVTNKRLRALQRAWTSGSPVRTLLLSWNQSMGPKGLNTLGALLSCNSTLRRVELAHCNLGGDLLRSFSSGLTAKSSVEELDLSGNDLDEIACLSLVPVLARLPLLSVLNLSSNGIQCAFAVILFQALRKNERLHTLNMAWNKLQDHGALELAQSLQCWRSLRKLALGWNPIQEDGLIAISRALFSTSCDAVSFAGIPSTVNFSIWISVLQLVRPEMQLTTSKIISAHSLRRLEVHCNTVSEILEGLYWSVNVNALAHESVRQQVLTVFTASRCGGNALSLLPTELVLHILSFLFLGQRQQPSPHGEGDEMLFPVDADDADFKWFWK